MPVVCLRWRIFRPVHRTAPVSQEALYKRLQIFQMCVIVKRLITVTLL